MRHFFRQWISLASGKQQASVKKHVETPSQYGGVFIESAIALPLFFLLFLCTADAARVAYDAVSMQYVLNKGVRWAMLGQALPNLSREQSIEQRIRDLGNEIGLNLSTADISICPAAQPNCVTDNAGGPNDMIVVKATITTPLLFNLAPFNLHSIVMARNEPYGQ